MKKIKVLHILDELNTGGAERIVYTYFKHFNKNQFQWDFVVTRYADTSKKGILEKKIESIGGKIYKVHRKRENYLRNILDIDYIIKNGQYDIVHSHLDELSAIYLLSAKIHKVPVRICHSHLAGTDRGFLVELLCKFFRLLLKHVITNKFACGNDAAKSLWGNNAIKDGSVYIMKNAIETDLFKFDVTIRNAKRNELNIREDCFVIGSIGRLSYQKNSDFIVDIFSEFHKKNQNSILLLVGVGDFLDLIEKKIKSYNLEGSVKLLGNRSDVNEIMMAMDLFILPSRFEGLPIVIVEAQCSGLPCIISDTITKEVSFSNNIRYLSLANTAKEWAEKILIQDIQVNRNLCSDTIKSVGYDINEASIDLQDYYKKILRKY